jgi:hypothetical protein
MTNYRLVLPAFPACWLACLASSACLLDGRLLVGWVLPALRDQLSACFACLACLLVGLSSQLSLPTGFACYA